METNGDIDIWRLMETNGDLRLETNGDYWRLETRNFYIY